MGTDSADLYPQIYETLARYFPDQPARRVRECASEVTRLTRGETDRWPPELLELAVAFPRALFSAYTMGQGAHDQASTPAPPRRQRRAG